MAREIRPDVDLEWPAPLELDHEPAEDHRPPLDDPGDRRWLDRDDPRRRELELELEAESEGGESE